MPGDEKIEFLKLTRMPYADQAKWFMNGFWKEGIEKDAETIWKSTQKFIDLDTTKKKEGNELDEFMAHKFLEYLGETLTVIQLREKLKKIDLDANGKMALLEYLAFKYNKSIAQVVFSPQGDNQDEVKEAQRKLEEVNKSLQEVATRYENQQIALEAQKKALANQQAALENLKKSESELKAAVDELKSQEDAFANQMKTLEDKSKSPDSTLVARNKAANELAQLKQENPLPLRKAKITQEAALRKVEKERKAADETAKALDLKTKYL